MAQSSKHMHCPPQRWDRRLVTYRDLPTSFHDSQEGVQQAGQGLAVCTLAVATKEGHKALYGIPLPQAGLQPGWVLP